MKKIILSFCASVLTTGLFASGFETDVSLFNELSSAYNSGFYPGAVQYAEKLNEDFPESAYIGSALVMEGESLVRLGQYEEAFDILKKAEDLDNDAELKSACKFYLARCYDNAKVYETALSYYYEYCRSMKEKGRLYPNAVLNAGFIYYKTSEYKKAVKNLEYAVKNGNRYLPSDYHSALLKLCDSYNHSGQAEKTISLYQKIPENKVPEEVYLALTEYAGDAYLKVGNYRKAYDFYCKVLYSGNKKLSANALKKAYNVSSEHRKEVGTEPGNVLQNVQKSLNDSPELLAEFWTRLGTDAFYDGDYKKALTYFDEAEKHITEELFEYISMYRCEITAGKKPGLQSARNAEKQLLSAQKIQMEMENPKYKTEYNELLVKYAAFQENWENVKKYSSRIINPSDKTNFYLALANYKTGNYPETARLLTGSDHELYALSLARQNNLKESARVYDISDASGKMTPEERLNYSKVLILSGRYRESQVQAAKCGLNEGKYILGLAQFNTRSWPYAEESFSSFIRNADKKDPGQAKEISYARFYLGYSQYRQNKCREAFSNLSAFISQYPFHELLWNAQMTSANAAVKLEKYDDARKMAEAAVKSSVTQQNKEDAVLLCAEIYSDSGEYEKAIALLSEFTRQKSDLGMKSLYQTAQIYEKMRDFARADLKYKETQEKFPSAKTGEEAMYRRGELYYGEQDFKTALFRFNEYKAKYPNGHYVDACWYYSADCMEKNGNRSSAILQNKALVTKFPDSSYHYSAVKNLVDLLRKNGEYQEALGYARALLEKYGEQAVNDGVQESVVQLEMLSGGKNEAIVQKESEFKKAGGMNTPEGRKAGTELAVLYSINEETAREAVMLSQELLPLQEKNNKNRSETLYAAQNADIIAQSLRNQQKNKESAEMNLKAARYYRECGRNDEAAQTMYNAYDAFIASGRPQDANATAVELKKLYPGTRQAKAVRTDN